MIKGCKFPGKLHNVISLEMHWNMWIWIYMFNTTKLHQVNYIDICNLTKFYLIVECCNWIKQKQRNEYECEVTMNYLCTIKLENLVSTLRKFWGNVEFCITGNCENLRYIMQRISFHPFCWILECLVPPSITSYLSATNGKHHVCYINNMTTNIYHVGFHLLCNFHS